MTDGQGFVLHPGAAQDIADIWEFIATDDPVAATRFIDNLLGAIRRLVDFPNQGHRRSDLTSAPLRFQTVREYLIAYAPEEKPLLVISVIHVRRNPRVMAASLRARE